MFKEKTVKAIYERTVAELDEVELLNQQRREMAQVQIDAATLKREAADSEVSKARKAKQGFASLFGFETQEQ